MTPAERLAAALAALAALNAFDSAMTRQPELRPEPRPRYDDPARTTPPRRPR
ncbi:hypothetical protein [Streptosporangium sp. NPDC048865]|uniref:hypothetical protein n=1 Tax=Streptosporangium sp. NPDC048865 TaxID=3155766 RepID=UPI003449073E